MKYDLAKRVKTCFDRSAYTLPSPYITLRDGGTDPIRRKGACRAVGDELNRIGSAKRQRRRVCQGEANLLDDFVSKFRVFLSSLLPVLLHTYFYVLLHFLLS